MDAPDEVLIVDDDPDMVEAILLVLHEAGYAVRSACNGKQALEQVAQRKPALILLDMLMPVMDGWQFARELHTMYGHVVPIVVVTAAEHVRTRGDEVGAADVLPKPFDLSDLVRVVERYVPKQARIGG